MSYVAPWWLPGGHLQTIWSALYARRVLGPPPRFKRERWITPDMDFVDVDFSDPAARVADPAADPSNRPLLVLFHGLEGSSASHYALAFADYARSHGIAFAVPHFRGCSGDLNLAPRAYHSGDFEEVDWILTRMRARHRGPVVAVGVSLGGNALLRWAEEKGAQASRVVRAVAAVSSPMDLVAVSRAISRGFNRQVYTRVFLRTMKPKAMAKYAQFPGLFDREALQSAHDLCTFDNVFTAPIHGFKNAEDYWVRASSKPRLADIRLPTLVVNACNDPFVPAWSLPRQNEVGEYVTLWQPSHGGHVGFPGGRIPGHVRDMPDQIGRWLAQAVR